MIPSETDSRRVMAGSGYASRKQAIVAAQEAMLARFGANIRFEPVPLSYPFPRNFRVLDERGNQLQTFWVFKVGAAIQEWAWQEATRPP
jgi:hypothetical protein